MLIILLYHRSFAGRYGNCLDTLQRHFSYLKEHYPLLLPSETLISGKLNVCVSFDDATYDFYHQVYPLLQETGIKALLAVPAGYIQERHNTPPAERLKILSSFSFHKDPPSQAFCSYEELREMTKSGLVEIASHGMFHKDLSHKEAPLEFEVIESKKVLEHELKRPIETFVFPYGGYHSKALKIVKSHYPVAMRIGSGINFSWNDHLHYRVSADEIEDLPSLFSKIQCIRYLINKIKPY